MKRLLLKVCALLLPVFILLAFPAYVLFQSGEMLTVSHVIEKQNSSIDHILYAPAYNSFEKYYKLSQLLKIKPDVLVLGNSRMLNLRSEFFNRNTNFYNGGLLAKKIQDFRVILQHIPKNKQPKIIIMGLEPTEFNSEITSFDSPSIEGELVEQSPWQYFLNVLLRDWISIYRDYFAGKFNLKDLANPQIKAKHIGMLAIANGEGFRVDGSYRNGRYILRSDYAVMTTALRFKATLDIITAQTGYFSPTTSLSPRALEELGSFLQDCRDRGIIVVGYFPPYPPTIFDKIKKNTGLNYLYTSPSIIRPIFQKFSFELYDFTDPATINAPDTEFYDGIHVGEKASLRYFINMTKASSVLGDLVDVKTLQSILGKAATNMEIFGP